MAWKQKIQDDTNPGVEVTGTGDDGTPGAGQSYFGWEWEAGAGDAGKQQGVFDAETVSAEADNQSSLELERKAQAEAAGVQDARFAGYAEVLANYEARADTEPLADRRARHLAVDPGDQDFARKAEYTGVSEAKQTTRSAD